MMIRSENTVSTKPHSYAFASFRVDASRRVLQTDAGSVIELPSRAFDTLLYLVERPGRVLEKSEIMRAVWPNVIVEENNLSQAIFAIRRALGDSAETQRYVATVPGRGYQFVEKVFPGPGPGSEAGPAMPDGGEHEAPGVRRISLWPRRLAVALVAGAALAAAVSWTLPGARPPTQHTLAVLPFKPLVVEQRDPMLEFGLTDTLISQLSQVSGLVVSPLSSVRRFVATDQDPVAAGRGLGVQSVLEGHVSRSGDLMHLSVRLIDVASGDPRWALDERFADVLAVQDAIVANVAAHLPGDIAGTWDSRALRPATRDPDAQQEYSTGRFYWADRTPPSVQRAIGHFEKAIDRDPQYALAYAALADCYAALAVFGVVEPHAAFAKAREAADRALELDPDLAEAHATMGHIHVQYDLDWGAGERSYRKAIALDPRYALAYMWLGVLYTYNGRFDEALAYMRTAQQLEPEQKVFSANIAHVLYHARRYDEAIQQLNHTLTMDENFDLALAYLGRAYLHTGNVDGALKAFERRRSQLFDKDADLIQAYAAAGKWEEARTLLAKMQQRAKGSYVNPCYFARAYISLGDQERALESLEQAFDARSQHLVSVPRDLAFEPLRGNPRYERLVARLPVAARAR